jgi:hypothetical protein
VKSPAPYLCGQNQYDRFVSHQYPGNTSVVLGPHFLAGAVRFWMGSHTRIVRVEAQCNLFRLAFSGWPGSATLHFQVCVGLAKYSAACFKALPNQDLSQKSTLPAPSRTWQSGKLLGAENVRPSREPSCPRRLYIP